MHIFMFCFAWSFLCSDCITHSNSARHTISIRRRYCRFLMTRTLRQESLKPQAYSSITSLTVLNMNLRLLQATG